MIVYVRIIHTVPIDVDPALYFDDHEGKPTPAEMAERAADDRDFAEMIGNGPHPVHEVDWEIVDDLNAIEWLADQHPLHEVEARLIRRSEVADRD